MSKETEKKVKTPSAVVAEKATEKAAAVATAVVEEKATPMVVQPPKIKRVPNFNFRKSELSEEEEKARQEQVTLNLKTISDLELDKFISTELKPYYSFNRSGFATSEAESSLTINGVKVEPVIKGIKATPGEIYSPTRTMEYELREHFVRSEANKENVFDIYIYKLSVNTDRVYGGHNSPEVDKLGDRLKDDTIYQMLILSAGSKAELTDKVRSPNPFGFSKEIMNTRVGRLIGINAQLKDVVFGDGVHVQDAELSDVRINDSVILGAEYNVSRLNNVFVDKSSLVGVTTLQTADNYGENRIIKSKLQLTYLGTRNFGIHRSHIKDCSFTAERVDVNKSRLTGIGLHANKAIGVRNTIAHFDKTRTFRSSENIKLNSIYDLTVVDIAAEARLTMVRGESSFWVQIQEDYENYDLIEIKTTNSEETYGGGYRFRPGMETISLSGRIEKAINSILGKSTITDQIIAHISRSLEERISISNSIATTEAMKKNSGSYEW